MCIRDSIIIRVVISFNSAIAASGKGSKQVGAGTGTDEISFNAAISACEANSEQKSAPTVSGRYRLSLLKEMPLDVISFSAAMSPLRA
eukprot:799455-Karenia_brevis.AAC.1